MASGRYKGRGRVTGSIVGKDKNWLDEGREERRFNHAMDVCKATIGQTCNCLICFHRTMKCVEAGVTTKLGARSWWKCTQCGHEVTREISPKQMEEYYIEDARKPSSNPQEASA